LVPLRYFGENAVQVEVVLDEMNGLIVARALRRDVLIRHLTRPTTVSAPREALERR
jgi:hypothetical protein